jgi:type II secretory pathway pseudopilin PulG
MEKKLNHRGFSILEAVASVFIISLILTTAVSIIINVRNQTEATNERIVATEVASRIRDDLVYNNTYDDMILWQNGQFVAVTSTTCSSLNTPFDCAIFQYESNGRVYDDTMALTFLAPTTESNFYKVVHFEITIEYYPRRFLTIEGIIYE